MIGNPHVDLREYGRKIWAARYFWYVLVTLELKWKFRRSRLGWLWAFLMPLMLTILLCVVMGAIFRLPFKEFAPFVFSGIIVWELLVSSLVGGCGSVLASEIYIKQQNHPLSIYSLKATLVNMLSFFIAFWGLVAWQLWYNPQNVLIGLASMPVTSVLLFLLGWPMATITGFVQVKFRDFQQVLTLFLQAVWYVSPVFLEPKIFKAAGLGYLVDYNPITHVLNLVRKPWLEGVFPDAVDFLYVGVWILVAFLLAIWKIKTEEREMIYYL